MINVCPAMAAWPQFVLHDANKMPYSPHTLLPFPKDSRWQTDPTQWMDYPTAAALAERLGFGLGFIFTVNDPFWFLDIDECITLGQYSTLAIELCSRFPGAAIEISTSGDGLHLFGQGVVPPHNKKNVPLNIELYTELRYVALTGTGLIGSAATAHDLTDLVTQYFDPSKSENGRGWTEEAAPRFNGPTDDADLLERAFKAKTVAGVFGGGATFKDLWMGDVDALAQAFPHKEKAFNFSSADAALAMHLAFWTGKNCERMLALMRESGLKRDKWERESYMVKTIQTAADKCRNYPGVDTDPNPIVSAQVTPAGELPAVTPLAGMQFLGPELQCEHFAGCVYVAREDKVSTPDGELMKRSSFDAVYGGFIFQLDDSGKKTTTSAWEAFTVSQILRHPKVTALGFRPDLPPRIVYQRDGVTHLNAYIDCRGERIPGDVTPFTIHLQKLIPDPNDREILLSYMAAVVQHPGVKFKWAPFIQGVEGNGKSLLTVVLQYCVGARYTFLPRSDEVTEKFNSWLFNNILIGVNDMYIAVERRSLWELYKPMITEERQAVRGMRAEWAADYVCANFLLNSNHKDALPRDENDRRAAPFFTPQQHKDDLVRDGMSGEYFNDLWRWLEGGGFAAVAAYLASYPIADHLNPATRCRRAPTTTSDAESIAESLGTVEQEILEAIAEGRPGFVGGWVSSVALAMLLDGARLSNRAPKSKRKALMARIGYTTHPALKDGRLSVISPTDGNTRPRLYLQRGHLALHLTNPDDIAKAYFNAQHRAVAGVVA